MPTLARVLRHIEQLLADDPSHADTIRAALPKPAKRPPKTAIVGTGAPAVIEPAPITPPVDQADTAASAPEQLDASTLGQEPGTILVDGEPPADTTEPPA